MSRLGSAALAVVWLGSAALVLVSAAAAPGQTVELADRRDFDTEVRARIEQVLLAAQYRVWAADTVLVPGDTVAGDVFVFRATARLAGTVTGQVIAVESELFVRPGAEIRGGALVVNGGYYGSQMARVGPVLHLPLADYRVRVEDGSYRIRAPRAESGPELPGIWGIVAPAYDRVNGVTIPWRVEYRPGRSLWVPWARATVRYRTARERVDGDLRLEWRGHGLSLVLDGGRTTATSEVWISGDLENSLASFGFAGDHRNYYETDFARGILEARHGPGAAWRHRLTLEWEESSSLGSAEPFSIFELEGGFQGNPPVDDGRIVAVRLGSAFRWALGGALLAGSAFFEVADRDAAGDFSYSRAGGELWWESATIATQSLRIRARGGARLGGTVPSQRWISLGGYGTLPTLEGLSLTGHTHLFIESSYFVPIFGTGLGGVVAWVRHAVGSAWVGARPPLDQNILLGVDIGPFALWLAADPSSEGPDLTPGFGLRQRFRRPGFAF